MSIFLSLLKWFFEKIVTIVFITVVVTGYFFVQDATEDWIQRQQARADKAREVYEEAKEIAGPKYAALKNKADAVAQKVNEYGEALDEAARKLKELEGKWRGFKAFWIPGGYNEEDWRREERRARQAKAAAEKGKREAQEQLNAMNRQVASFRATILNEEELRTAEQNAELEQQKLDDRKRVVSDFKGDIARAWEEGKDIVITVALIVFLGPMVWKLFGYWCVGGLALRLPYLHLLDEDKESPGMARIGESCPSLKIPLSPDDTLVVKERFLQASKEGVEKETQYIWNRRYPFLSIVAGLIFLTRVRVVGKSGGVTLSCDDDPAIEVIRVDVQRGEELVIRPGFLVGYLFQKDALKIRTTWDFGLQSWMTLKFRSFLIEGDGAIFLAAGRGFSEEQIGSSLIVDRDIPVLWSPVLGFKARRAETFWSYALNQNNLFDDEFRGEGMVLCQQVRGFGGGRDAESFWARFFSILGKIFGL